MPQKKKKVPVKTEAEVLSENGNESDGDDDDASMSDLGGDLGLGSDAEEDDDGDEDEDMYDGLADSDDGSGESSRTRASGKGKAKGKGRNAKEKRGGVFGSPTHNAQRHKARQKHKARESEVCEKDCLLCENNSDEADPIDPEQKLLWGYERFPQGVTGWHCYYCRRLQRSKVGWGKKTLKQIRKMLKQNPKLRKEWKKDRAKVIVILKLKGKDTRLNLCDFNSKVVIDAVNAMGERSWRGGTKFREDIFVTRFSEEERRTMKTNKEAIWNDEKQKMENWIRVFEDVDGVEKFQIYTDDQHRKTATVSDGLMGNEQARDDLNELVNDAREGINLRQSLTVADLPHNAAPMSREQLNEQKRKDKLKRKLKLSLSNCSSQHSGEQEEAPLAGLTAPESAKKKKKQEKEAQKQQEEEGNNLLQQFSGQDANTPSRGGSMVQVKDGDFDEVSSKPVQKFVNKVAGRVSTCQTLLAKLLRCETLAASNEDEIISAIRTLSGFSGKILQNNLTKTKAITDIGVHQLRAMSSLTRAGKTYDKKRTEAALTSTVRHTPCALHLRVSLRVRKMCPKIAEFDNYLGVWNS